MLMADGKPAANMFAAGEIMAGNVLGRGYAAGIGMTIGSVFGRIAGTGGAQMPAMTAPDWTSALAEADRLMTLCNSCRYCEGLCAVFPAMEMRRAFPDGDLNYLANLCHSCGACYVDCQFSPPHEFDVNVPQRAGAGARRTPTRPMRGRARCRGHVRAQRVGDHPSSLR